jgi:hypothetical protein
MRLTENDIIRRLKEDSDRYAPLKIDSIEEQVSLSEGYRADGVVEFSIRDGAKFKALVEIAPVSTPKNILDKTMLLNDYIKKVESPDMVPMIIAPYIGAKQSKILADKGISWMDLSGNMSIRIANRIYIERTGKPNRFPDTSPIKKIFQGKSALVSRALLLKPEGFSKLNEIVDFINNRNTNVKISLVSKVLKVLEEELLVTKKKKHIFVTEPEKLLDRLVDGYRNSTERKSRNIYKCTIGDIGQLSGGITGYCKDYLACGFYAAQIKGLAVTEQKSIIVKDIGQFKKIAEEKLVSFAFDSEFGNYIVTETTDPGVWFNPSFRVIDSVVDDIELYLEMMVDTPRGPKIAEQLKQRILRRTGSDE